MQQNTTTAVEFDVAAFRNWINGVDTAGATLAETDPYLSVAYDVLNGDAGWLAASTLTALKGASAVWRQGQGILVNAMPLAGDEGDTDGVVVEVLVGNQWLSVGRIAQSTLVPIAEDDRIPGYEAAIIALETIARLVNERVDHYLRPSASGSKQDYADVVADTYNRNLTVGLEGDDERPSDDFNHAANPAHY